ncbi:MAG TPA: translation elongation factor Ts [Atopobiaceae bacterium]|nr:translation elongation factor Ts [Atopobiaceae bacterium]
MAITADMVKTLRQATGAGVMDCKKVLEQTGGDMEKASAILREKALAAAEKKAERKTSEGRVEAYVHPGSKLAVLVEVNCETDFVARTEQFTTFCHDVAMQVAASSPRWVSRSDVPPEVLEEEQNNYRMQMAGENKPEAVMQRIIEGKLNKFFQENVLLEQPFIKDDSRTIQQLLTEKIAQIGENIVISRFARFQIG